VEVILRKSLINYHPSSGIENLRKMTPILEKPQKVGGCETNLSSIIAHVAKEVA
jgi:hypothetical protein